MSSEKLTELLSEKIKSAANGDSFQPIVIRRGQVCTKEGLVVTGEEAYKAIKSQQKIHKNKCRDKKIANTAAELVFEEGKALKKTAPEVFDRWALDQRITKYNVPNKFPRSLASRRAVARMKALQKKSEKSHTGAHYTSVF